MDLTYSAYAVGDSRDCLCRVAALLAFVALFTMVALCCNVSALAPEPLAFVTAFAMLGPVLQCVCSRSRAAHLCRPVCMLGWVRYHNLSGIVPEPPALVAMFVWRTVYHNLLSSCARASICEALAFALPEFAFPVAPFLCVALGVRLAASSSDLVAVLSVCHGICSLWLVALLVHMTFTADRVVLDSLVLPIVPRVSRPPESRPLLSPVRQCVISPAPLVEMDINKGYFSSSPQISPPLSHAPLLP